MSQIEIEIPTKAPSSEKFPHYGSIGAAGADVRANIDEELEIPPGEKALIPTGLFFEIPEGYEMQVRPRSSLALNHQITVLNTPGTIDCDYRGELKVLLINHGRESFTVTPGMRIAQLILAPVIRARFLPCEKLAATERGEGGFGSTGTH